MRSGFGLLALLLLLSAAVKCNSMSPPGKPVLLSCRSPEKETFSCWWEPGSDGGLPTTHHLHYTREGLEGMLECPDYRSAGRNSCFFNKNHTSIWVDYHLTVVAYNALGNASSDTLKMDLMQIVKPNAPENVTSLLVEEREHSLYLHIRWERPHNTDTKSGWVTIKYELRVKQGNSDNWQDYMSGTETHFKLYSVSPGVEYTVQVHCRLDHSSWSEWSNATYVTIPDYLQSGRLLWIMVSTLPAFPFIAAMCILVKKRKNVRQCVLPPVPGPKIIGVDYKLLKSRRSEDINALITNQGFPLTVACKDQMEDFLIVTDNDDELHVNPSNSQKKKKSFIVPAGFLFDKEIQCKESNSGHNEWEKAEERKNDIDNFVLTNTSLSGEGLSNIEPTQKQQRTNCINTGATEQSLNQENIVKLFTNSGYVDIQRHEENKQEVDYSRVKVVNGDTILILEKEKEALNTSESMEVQNQEEKVSEDYSRVNKVHGDNMVFVQKHNELVDTSCSREKGNHYTDRVLQKPGHPYKVGSCTELIDGGYVETIPAPLLM